MVADGFHPTPDSCGADFSDTAALRAIAGAGQGALCTITAIEGSYSRRVGAQLAILDGGRTIGSLADGCLEAQLARLVTDEPERPQNIRFGAGSPMIDFRLPCGSGIDIHVDPQPDIAALRLAAAQLDRRRPAEIAIKLDRRPTFTRYYRPELRIAVFGSGPEIDSLARQARQFGAAVALAHPRTSGTEDGLVLGRSPTIAIDPWTAIILLFHDHEWERALVPWALRSPAFYVGAQGGAEARRQRTALLAESGLALPMRQRLHSPVGLIPQARDPSVLGLSILADIVAAYEMLPEQHGAILSGMD